MGEQGVVGSERPCGPVPGGAAGPRALSLRGREKGGGIGSVRFMWAPIPHLGEGKSGAAASVRGEAYLPQPIPTAGL